MANNAKKERRLGDDFLSVRSAAQEAGVVTQTVYNWLAEQRFPSQDVDGITLIERDGWDRFMAGRKVKESDK